MQHRLLPYLPWSDIAREEGIKVVQIIGQKDVSYTRVPNAGVLYSWNWENLKKLLG